MYLKKAFFMKRLTLYIYIFLIYYILYSIIYWINEPGHTDPEYLKDANVAANQQPDFFEYVNKIGLNLCLFFNLNLD